GVARDIALIDWAIRHRRDAARAQPGQQVELGAALAQRVVDLVGGATRATRYRTQFLHVVGVEISDAPMSDAALALQRLERVDRVGERVGAAPVQQIEVDVIELEALQASLAGRDRSAATRVVRI